MSQDQLVSAVKILCIPGGRYSIEVLGKYIQQSYNLEDIFEIKSVLLHMLNAQELELTDDFMITRTKK